MKIMQAMREGRYKTLKQAAAERAEKKKNMHKDMYMIWNEAEDEVLAESKRHQYHLPAPKMPLPGHDESYNPPKEYLLTSEEEARRAKIDEEEHQHTFVPKAHSCLRHVGGYEHFVKERFERCLDLYLCPRKLKKRLNIDPETLVPRLPKPKELKPFPNSLCLQYLGHKGAVRSISISPDGQYMVSGGDDGTVRLWEVDTCLCRHTWSIGGGGGVAGGVTKAVTNVSWNPNANNCVVAASVGRRVVLIATGTGDVESTEISEAFLAAAELGAGDKSAGDDDDDDEGGDEGGGKAMEEEQEEDEGGDVDNEEEKEGGGAGKGKPVASWHLPAAARSSSSSYSSSSIQNMRHGARVGPRVLLRVGGAVSTCVWHHKGDYLATVSPSLGSKSVAIHQISKAKTQTPFSKNPGLVQCVLFHPSRPFLFVATQQHVRVFNLVEQKLIKKLLSGCKWISSMAVHPKGDHLIIGSYDRRVVWFDLDLSSSPYKTLKYHEKAVRAVTYHPRYPLFVSSSDDGNIHVFHCAVYDDLNRNPLIVPLKVLRGHGVTKASASARLGGGVLSVSFHPKQPWVFTAGLDGIINLFQDI